MDLDRNKEIVAVKKIERVFDHPTFTKRTLREIRVLRLLKHENVISLQSIFATTTTTTMGTRFDDLYLVFDLMQTDLASIIKSPQPLSAQHVQFFLYQLLRGLKFLHSAGIIHRDIKPRNLLVNSNCDLKICDMGLARFDNSQLVPPGRPMQENGSVPEMTDYVATRWYRAPEIILQWAGYSKAIDMWAVGCILAELLARKPLFPGTDADHQITLICDVLGRPALDLLDKCQHEETKQFLLEIPVKAKRPLAVYPKTNDISAVDLLTRLLRFDPDKRLTVDKCLQHHYLSQLHCPSDEPESIPLDLARDFPFDAKDSSTAMLQEYVWKEIEIMGALYGDDTVSPSTSSSSVVIMPPPSPASKSAKFKKSSSLHQNSPLTSKRGPSIPTSQPSTTIPPPSSVVDAAATAATTTTATTTTTTTAASIRRTPKPPSTTAPPIGPRPVPKAFAHKPPANTRPSPQTAAAAAVAAVLCKREEGDQTDFSPRVVHTPIFEDDSMHTPKTTDPPAQQQQQQQQGGLDLRRGLTAPLGS
ncbi:hypothetical protein BASA81_007428 [Batrachochytrium salamandrivorans]|nr:hypothetical protein BASA81_007428 [Batrachochytrium salamandrivorans]